MHIPVLLKESINFLRPKKGNTILDATINGGGHAEMIMKEIGKEGMLVGIDQDAETLESLRNKIQETRYKQNIIFNK